MHLLGARGRDVNECLIAVFKKDLEKDVAGDTSGDFAKLLLALVEVGRLSYGCFN